VTMAGSGGRGRMDAIIHAGILGQYDRVKCIMRRGLTQWEYESHAKEQYLPILATEEQRAEGIVKRGSLPSAEASLAPSVLPQSRREHLRYGSPRRPDDVRLLLYRSLRDH
jgi:hypothetical protein